MSTCDTPAARSATRLAEQLAERSRSIDVARVRTEVAVSATQRRIEREPALLRRVRAKADAVSGLRGTDVSCRSDRD